MKKLETIKMIQYFKYSLFVFTLCFITACIQVSQDNTLTQKISFNANGESFVMTFVEGGTFIRGCTSEQGNDCEEVEKPAYQDTVSTFFIGEHEVTQKLWKAVMGYNQSYNSDCENCPAERISWDDAQEFINKLNTLTGKTFRLPSEGEWEYAARGGLYSKGYKFSGSNNLNQVAWYIDNYQKNKHGVRGTTHPVGGKRPNELGLYDMSGNVWEWCDDLYMKEYYHNGKLISPEWPFKGSPLYFRRVLRGGSWGGNPKGCRVSYIDYDIAKYRDEYGGFRLALTFDEETSVLIE